jgi:uncharacterized small protein (DUF1192 family)
MALVSAVIKANAALASLTDEQVAAIEELSRNDENTVIGTRIGELHGQYDQDVLSVTGVAKNQGEKSYDYVKRVLGDYKTRLASVAGQEQTIANLQKEIEGYKATIAQNGNGDPVLQQQLKDAQKQLSDTQALLDATKKDWEGKYNNLNTQYQGSLIDAEFGKALQGVKFKSVYPESVQRTLIDSAKRSVLSANKADWVENNGSRTLVFRGADGNILTNPENKLNPFTAGELLMKELKEVIDNGVKQTGTGTDPLNNGVGAGGAVDLSGATTQVAADELISKYLMTNGYTRGSQEFSDKAMELRKANGVDKLPIQ